MSMRGGVERCGHRLRTLIGAFNGTFQGRGKIGGSPGPSQEEIGKRCRRNGSVDLRPSLAGEEWADLPNNVGFAGF
jgi:hypothetical protein